MYFKNIFYILNTIHSTSNTLHTQAENPLKMKITFNKVEYISQIKSFRVYIFFISLCYEKKVLRNVT